MKLLLIILSINATFPQTFLLNDFSKIRRELIRSEKIFKMLPFGAFHSKFS